VRCFLTKQLKQEERQSREKEVNTLINILVGVACALVIYEHVKRYFRK